jgi:copper homeostasis protein
MKRDIETCKRASVDGIVFGILKSDATLDKNRCRKLIELARPLKATCHRAFDVTADSFQALEDCVEIGFDRILTSGRKPKAVDGIETLRELVNRAAGRISIMPGSGVNEENVTKILDESGANEIHFSAMSFAPGKTALANPEVGFVSKTNWEWPNITLADAGKVKRIVEILKRN